MKPKIAWIIAFCFGLIFLTACAGRTETTTRPAVTARPTVRVTVPEGYTVYQIALLLEEKEVCPSEAFVAAVNSPPQGEPFAASIANAAERPFLLEGYLFPDTYDFYIGESAESALNRFLSNMKAKINPEDYGRAAELGYSMDQIITIASIIQEEAGTPEQDPKVSSVLHNRLNSKSFPRLGFNVTFEYLDNSVEPFIPGGREKYNGFYNTYDRIGLPAGPICNPGSSSITAALYPADTDYYYFLTDIDRNFYYSETYAEHTKLWAKYKH